MYKHISFLFFAFLFLLFHIGYSECGLPGRIHKKSRGISTMEEYSKEADIRLKLLLQTVRYKLKLQTNTNSKPKKQNPKFKTCRLNLGDIGRKK